MSELIDNALLTVNFPYTVLLLLILAYWIVVILGVLDIDAFDLDLGTDADLGGDMGGAGGFSMLAFLNVNAVPLMLYVSIVILSMWVISVQVNQLLEPWLGRDNVWLATVLAVPNLIFSLLVAKFLVIPAKRFARRSAQRTPLVGKLCHVVSMTIDENHGQCQVDLGGAPLLLSAVTREGEVLNRGDAAVIVERRDGAEGFVVTKYGDGSAA